VCADLIDSKRADAALYIIMCVYSHKRLACVTLYALVKFLFQIGDAVASS
jgi:hypothetical protein